MVFYRDQIKAYIDGIPEKYIYDPDFKSKPKTLLLGDAIGVKKYK